MACCRGVPVTPWETPITVAFIVHSLRPQHPNRPRFASETLPSRNRSWEQKVGRGRDFLRLGDADEPSYNYTLRRLPRGGILHAGQRLPVPSLPAPPPFGARQIHLGDCTVGPCDGGEGPGRPRWTRPTGPQSLGRRGRLRNADRVARMGHAPSFGERLRRGTNHSNPGAGGRWIEAGRPLLDLRSRSRRRAGRLRARRQCDDASRGERASTGQSVALVRHRTRVLRAVSHQGAGDPLRQQTSAWNAACHTI